MYIALKPINFGGQDFLINDIIPEEFVDPAKVKQLEKQRIIAVQGSDGFAPVAQEGQVRFTIPVHAEEGDAPLKLTQEELVSVTDVLQANTDEAGKIIATIEKSEPLILIDVLDSRKAVKKLVRERAAVLFPEPEEKTGEN